MIINCIAIDDEPLALEIIKAYCTKIPSLNLVKTFNNPLEGIAFLQTHDNIDILFLDIQMNEYNGLDFIKNLHIRPLIILTTAYESYALKSFELNVLDYLLKPISFERFLQAVDKAINHLRNFNLQQENEHPANPETSYFFVKSESRIEKVDIDDVLYVEGRGDYWRIITKTRKIMTLMNAKSIEEILSEPRFCRVHKSYFIAIDKIDFVERKQIKIGGELIPISDTYQKHFFDIIEKFKMI